MTTVRRLADADVRAIFESIHDKKPAPHHLKFTIIPIGPTGLKLSPPSFEFEDGLYILLKPQKKKKGAIDLSKVPSHLMNLVAQEMPPENCPWSLSGPQFPQPTAIQQRYCYPKGRVQYSGQKGGALWTMYDAQGKEDTEYRLLHVYYSAKRAISDAHSPPAAKRPKTKGRPRGGGRGGGRGGRGLATPRRTPKTRTVPGSAAAHQVISPAVTASSNSHCGSPGSIDTLPAPSYHFSPRTATHPGGGTRSYEQMLKDHPMPPINSHNLIAFNEAESYDKFHSAQFHPVGQNVELRQSLSFGIPGGLNPPFGNFKNDDKTNPKRRTTNQQDNLMIDTFGNADDMLTIFNDPMVSLSTKPSFDHLDPPSAIAGSAATMNTGVKSFAHHLETIHNSIRDNIRNAPSGDQCAMLSVYASWAKQISFNPMGKLVSGVSAGNTTSTKKGSTRKTSSSTSTATKKKTTTKGRKPKRATKKKTTAAAAPSPHVMTV